MNFADAPAYTPTPFATSGTKNAIPATSTGAAASFTSGFPDVTMQPIDAGGTPPDGKDMNGILFDLSSGMRFYQAGGVYGYDATFSTAVAGYPKGALLKRADGNGYWVNQTDANTSNPDASGAGWAPIRANLGVTSIAMVVGTNTPTAAQLANETLVLTGSIASAATLQLPLTAGANWIIYNNTTGAGALNVAGATGASVAVPQSAALQVFSDGTNFYAISAPTTGAYLPLHGTADAAQVLATPRNFSISGFATAAAVAFDGSGNIILNVAALNVPGALGYTPANDASVVHLAGTETISGAKTFGAAMNGTSATFSGAMKALSFQETSTRRLKRDLERLEDPFERLAPVNAWTGRYLKKIDKTEKQRTFLLLEELYGTVPEAVFSADSVDYTALIPILVAAVKQLDTRVRELESRGQ